MIEKTLITTHGKLRVAIPSQLNEVTLGQMMALQDNPNLGDLDAISILSGVPVADLKTVRDAGDFMAFADAVLSLSHQIKHLYNSDEIPKQVSLEIDQKNVTVKVISNLSVEPAGAFMAARDVIADEITEHVKIYGEENWKNYFNPSLTACCKVLAYYFYCLATGNVYDEYAAAAFTETIKKLRVTEALPIAKHFFMSYPNLSKPRTGYWHRLQRLWKNARASSRSRSLNTSTP
ncbi:MULTISPECIES: hypothetical protein [unclassified Mucilaginibacter]|uniref:hypothetical protein n=1 Tax=unclassified Mucilaginibacter TaxID=2617802 RepID=UPI002AC9BA3C|nr:MULTISPECIES: hypothetical protein [unclassified Mucilaginibacter]MEB0249620.1 hypothetical protein [Mucilaginibacter sp. 5B2]MEB0262648.1 hypothetical protein [Mucilaginibacter sp. 10I4]MEB0280600.1 hypothetical protein [Mucilaginibacter sp. 10B2]MEB0300798.1 hypothetical protein [Mucilaginibacter sp. 5C4]WPX24982.1 hypothetical protein RHM67_06865 [Mucilaginibacter sp. 5C4]